MRRVAVLLIATAGVVTSCGGDVSCVDVSADAMEASGFNATITGATEGPDDIRGAEMWYLASSTGGLWLADMNPATGNDEGALVFPMNSQALEEDDVGADAGLGAGDIVPDADADSAAAKKALECASEGT